MNDRQNRVLEKYYSLRELTYQLGFSERFWREKAQQGELMLQDGQGNLISEPVEIAGELRIPASAINAFLARHAYRYDAGVKARNLGELRRKLAGQNQQQVP
jgi:hypothetical protein